MKKSQSNEKRTGKARLLPLHLLPVAGVPHRRDLVRSLKKVITNTAIIVNTTDKAIKKKKKKKKGIEKNNKIHGIETEIRREARKKINQIEKDKEKEIGTTKIIEIMKKNILEKNIGTGMIK